MPLPKQPQYVSVIRSEDRESFLISWDAVTEDVLGDPGEVTKYGIFVSELANGLRVELTAEVAHNPATNRHYTVLHTVQLPGVTSPTPIDPDMLYFFKVAAYNYENLYGAPYNQGGDYGEASPQETDL